MIRVFPTRTSLTPNDDLTRFDRPGLFDHDDGSPVRVSCTFTWDKHRAEWLADQWSARFSDVELSGPAYDDPGGEFVSGRFVAEGAVITSRGCPQSCDFCLVPKREGSLRELNHIADGWNVLDNNLLACSEPHLDRVFEMLARQKTPIKFSGGLEAALLRSDHIDRFLKIKIGELWFAADSNAAIEPLRKVAKMLDDAGIINVNKRRCYVLFDPAKETIQKAHSRAKEVLAMGFLPFAQVRRDEEQLKRKPDKTWADLARYWSRPAIYRSHSR